MRILYDYAMSFVGTPYRWGGDDSIDGFDCSGFVQELLMSAGEDPEGDQTAQGLFNWFSSMGRARHDVWDLGSLIFFGESVTKITHIGFLLDAYRMVEAGGGGSATKTIKDAAEQNAFIRVRLIESRKDKVAILKPYYRRIGMI